MKKSHTGGAEMTQLKTFITSKFSYILLSIIYISTQLPILTRFPFVHSDETWLSGLSRNIMETGSYAVTEAFFDLYPRHPHAIKSLFHTLQIIFIKAFGYEIFSIRLLSFLFGLLTLFFFHRLCTRIFDSKPLALVATLLLAMDIQFIYASHFARQEIIVLFVLIFSLNFFARSLPNMKLVHHLALGMIIGMSIGLHPNSFIICLPIVFLYIFHIAFTKKLKLADLFVYIAPVTAFALVFIALSLCFDANFIANYTQFGSQFGVNHSLSAKLAEIPNYYSKLFYGISGTYYTPNIQLEFYLFAIVLVASIVFLLITGQKKMKEIFISIILIIVAINIGIILIGRYSQPSIVFLIPFLYLLVTFVLTFIRKNIRICLAILLLFLITTNSVLNALPYLNHSYAGYLQEIGKVVEKDDIVLANLNAEMYFDNGKLFDYRNLAYLQEHNLTFEEYIESNQIAYIIYPEEMDFLYENRLIWNDFYGDISLYYEDMQSFLQTKSQLVYQFSEPSYGMRIARYINQKDWQIRIYKVN
ncbi:glycosyltransferase family 39 protein [Desulfitobacterium sp. THU1]|uniref:glycosyltransferase family 39 protein n=1 Tax=Desulfitobacterium sp. THU1 TaxID=3138072 RepID=UPI00311D821D